MDYEKEYKGALERARKLYHYDNGETTAEVAIACATIFPELEESEDKDERIRKKLIQYVKNWKAYYDNKGCISPLWTSDKKECNEMLAWLEKQGEQKSVDYENINLQPNEFAPKVEPKFKKD